MSLVDDIATFLDASSTAFTILAGTAGNLAKMISLDHAHAGDTMAVIYETPGAGSDFAFSTATGGVSVVFERPTFQILSRATTWTTARSQAQAAYTLLDGLADRNLPTGTGTRYRQITAVTPPFFVNRDRNDRYIASVDFSVEKEA